MERLDRALLETDAGKAAIAAAWCHGYFQKDIAKCFGFKGPAPVCARIVAFIGKFNPDAETWRHYGDDRKRQARIALTEYHKRLWAVEPGLLG